MRFAWANVDAYEKADVVLFGVPDESGSHSKRRGAALGPDAIRRVSNERYVVFRGGQRSVFQTYCPITQRIFDYGNVKKKSVSEIVAKIVGDKKISERGSETSNARRSKMPVCVGGDHSITFDVLNGFSTRLSVVYFDAHPDFICSTKTYYGSVMCDIYGLKNVDIKRSVMVGTRAPEPGELESAHEHGITTITPVDIAHYGVAHAFETIKKLVGSHVYLSIDMDVLDPSFAPGVDTPIPGGLTSNELIYLVKRIAQLGLIGFDVMETSPPHDRDDLTASTAAKLIAEVISCS